MQDLKNQTVFIAQRNVSKAVPVTLHGAFEQILWQLDVDFIFVALPQPEVDLDRPLELRRVKCCRSLVKTDFRIRPAIQEGMIGLRVLLAVTGPLEYLISHFHG